MFIPEDRDQAMVKTPYGRGMVVRTRKQSRDDGKSSTTKMREIELLDWSKSSQKNRQRRHPSMLYSTTDFPSIEARVGSEVMTLFGRGKVLEIQESSGMLEVRISSWRLAGRSHVICYLAPKSVQVVRPKELYEMTAFEKVEFAQELKEEANQIFSAKKYDEALQLYAKAVDAVRYVQHKEDSTNGLRADLLVVMITCCNNAATCSAQLKDWERAQKFGKNALVLLEALYEKRDNSRILRLLNREGFSESKLFGAWMVKSQLMICRALVERGNTSEALGQLKTAQQYVSRYKNESDPIFRQLQSQEKEIRRLILVCKENRKTERKREKQRALAMFASAEEKKENDGHEGPSCKTPITSQKTPMSTTESEGVKPTLHSPVSEIRSVDSAPQDSPSESVKKRVSFADGTSPGDVDDDQPLSILDEHKEALLIIAGLLLGVVCTRAYFGRRK